MTPKPRLALLIDADNGGGKYIEVLLATISRLGHATVRRAYGDWTTTNLRDWKCVLNEKAIQPIQQFRYTTGKNATDSALIIDAMDLLYNAKLDGFCLVSSDSDFTRLATRLREAGLSVYGFGRAETPGAFVAACDCFTFLDQIAGDKQSAPTAMPVAATSPAKRPLDLGDLTAPLISAIKMSADINGYAQLSKLGSIPAVSTPLNKYRASKSEKLGDFLRRLDYVEVKEVVAPGSVKLSAHVRLIENRAKYAMPQLSIVES